ncbi:unnamed protein product [Candidula unifasciata]|uniref:SOCS box domain-containing protein n=1 Tax=Candidula unifasciata TaxID=100452 RepID=A0A8S3ZM10_9EUPU|nr:unnamed protein product [Candidula unifasciata]
MAEWQGTDYSSQIEAAIINNQPDADINICLNNQRDSPLFLAVKLSHRDIVKILLSSPGCNLAHQNINQYSPLDLALVMVFNNQKEPRQSACWDILELLLEAGAESSCPDAMLYVVRTALKLNDDQFLFHLIHTLTACCTSLNMHALLLRKLHRHQPMYTGVNNDLFFEQASDLSVKLIKLYTNKDSLQQIVECFPYYADSHWDVREARNRLFIKLIIYLTVAGWQWTNQADLQYMRLICTNLSQWCYQMLRTVPSLTHLCRLSLTSSPSARQSIIPLRVPNILLSYLDYKDIDSLAPFTSTFDFSSVQL